ncbi:DUF2630 family protein [Actinophytocola sp.]|uniref:DUF2630 family protein n=1 Tax=Actinophytocola sp. TaxID=1872138 RepID=UPI003D6AFABE
MDDKVISSRIGELIDEEHQLERGGRPDPKRLEDLEIELDRCWNLLRQRRARRAAGEDPDVAQVRSSDVVERCLQ